MTIVCPKCNHADFAPTDECPKCGVIYAKVLRTGDIVANAKQSGNWANVPPSAVTRALKEVVLTTTHTVPGKGDFEIIDVVSAEVAFGMNLLKDFFADITDVVGGRSGATQKVLRDAKHAALNELRRTALQLGADAVVGMDLDYSEFSGGGKSMLFIVASGTAVRFTRTD